MPTRLRSSLDGMTVIYPPPQTMINGSVVHLFNNFPNYYFPHDFSWIRDVVGKQGSQNPVNQVKIRLYASRGYEPLVYPPTGNTYSFLPNGSTIWIPTSGGPPAFQDWPWFAPISAATLSSWSLEAYTKFQEQVPTKISLANSLYELKDIKGLIPNVNPRKLKEFSSGNFLAYEFGVLPMISDIKAVVALSSDVDKRIKHLISINGKSTNLSFDRDEKNDSPYAFFVSNDNPSASNFINYDISDDSGQGIVFKRLSSSYHFHIGGKLYQDLNDLKDSNAKLKGLIAAGGFNHPGRVIWNAIPYSFVVDWFFSVGKLIDTLSVQPFGGTYTVDRVMWSVTSEAVYQVIVQWGHGWSVNRVNIGQVRVKIYERYKGFPAYSVFLTDGTLTPMQQALGLAMIHQRI